LSRRDRLPFMPATLYTPNDLKRWTQSSEKMRPIFAKKVGQYVEGNRIPRQLSRFLQDEAFIAIASGRGDDALGYFKASTLNEIILWRDLIAGGSDREARESIREAGYGPIIAACVVHRDLAVQAADLFARTTEFIDYEEGVIRFGFFLGELINGRTSPSEIVPECQDPFLWAIASSLNRREPHAISDAIIAGANDWRDYILTDRGWPNSVCYVIGLAFTGLAREIWDESFSVSHFLVPMFVVESTPNDTVAAGFVPT
jgi:hypothetical protein